MSLDESGELRYWETSIYSPIDKEERQIDAVAVLEDHLRTVEAFTGAGTGFDTMHGLVIFAAGKKQQVYKVIDTSPHVSAPSKILFSGNLLMLISIHLKDVLFRHAVTGKLLI